MIPVCVSQGLRTQWEQGYSFQSYVAYDTESQHTRLIDVNVEGFPPLCLATWKGIKDGLKTRMLLLKFHDRETRVLKEQFTITALYALRYACPLCFKSVCDMSKHWEKLDMEIAATPMPQFYQDKLEEVAKELGIPVQYQRFWLWGKRENYTYRPHRRLTHLEEAQPVGHLGKVSHKINKLNLFLEVGLEQDSQKEDILLFFKLYDPIKEELRYAGRLFVKATGKPTEILTKLNELAGFVPDEDIELFEEIRFDEPKVMCEHVDKNRTYRASQFVFFDHVSEITTFCFLVYDTVQLQDGDIICLQKRHQAGAVKCRYPNVPSFLEYVHNRQVVRFRSLEKPMEDEFSLVLSKLNNYDDVVERVAGHLSLDDPSKIRLTSHNCYSQQPKPQPIKYRGVEHLSDMLTHYNQTSDILYYEVLDIPLPELESLKTLKVAFHHATKDEVVTHTIRLPKQSTVADMINDLKTKVELSHKDAELRLVEVFYHKIYKVELSHKDAELRLVEIFYHKIYKIFQLNEKIENINDQYWTIRAEEIPEEQKDLGPQHSLIHVYHFTKDSSQNQVQIQNFGEPFLFVIRDDETLAEIKLRIQNKLHVPNEEFSKWKFAFVSLGNPRYLQDSDVVSTLFKKFDIYGAWELYLGLEHSENAYKRGWLKGEASKATALGP
ncbi:ubiquitin-specific protease 13 [Artemisia annua]|uniref:ubiquitinyl hydrolase 1 n=1 Tax=Artemisia annua TaxID=35608 RepID=A0A2U1LNT3_ARTAN|nr:ubiquitin-specific protease 13 [Artemisia annua]